MFVRPPQVWSSSDGATWVQVNSGTTITADIQGYAVLLTFDSKLYLLGGRGTSAYCGTTVLISSDGVTWASGSSMLECLGDFAAVALSSSIVVIDGTDPAVGVMSVGYRYVSGALGECPVTLRHPIPLHSSVTGGGGGC